MNSEPIGPAPQRPPLWRDVTAGTSWALIGLSVCALGYLFWQELGWGISLALHGKPDVAARVPRYWGFVAVSSVLGLVVIATVIARRWVALVLALVLASGSGILAAGIWPSVQPLVAPVQQSDQPVRHCQCSSGGDCDCPGG